MVAGPAALKPVCEIFHKLALKPWRLASAGAFARRPRGTTFSKILLPNFPSPIIKLRALLAGDLATALATVK
jgi:hypothetical protein